MRNAGTSKLTGRKGTGAMLGACLVALAFSAAAAQPGKPTLIVLSSTDAASFQQEVSMLQRDGVRVLHLFPPSAVIAQAQDGSKNIPAGPSVGAVYQSAIQPDQVEQFTGSARLVAEAWNGAFWGTLPGGQATLDSPEDDALATPVEALGPVGPNGLACTADAPCEDGERVHARQHLSQRHPPPEHGAIDAEHGGVGCGARSPGPGGSRGGHTVAIWTGAPPARAWPSPSPTTSIRAGPTPAPPPLTSPSAATRIRFTSRVREKACGPTRS